MQEQIFKIKNKLGLHARAATLFIQIANLYKAKIKVLKNDQEVDGRSAIGLLSLAAGYDSCIRVIVDGEDENELLKDIKRLIENKFNEE